MGDKMNNEQRKVVLVGVGFVGMSLAYSLLNTGGIDELVLIDQNYEKAIGEAMDLNHGLPYLNKKILVRPGDYSECQDADVVVICAGANQKEGQSRLELTQINAKIMRDITNKVMENHFDGIFVEYPANDFNSITLAYCMSIHKAQGSEFKIVILPILNDYYVMLQKKLLYTGITRAKQSLFLLGQRQAFVRGITTQKTKERCTYLKERFNEEKGMSPYDFMD